MVLDVKEELVAFPVGRYQRTEQNLRRDNRVWLLAASRKVKGTRSPGQGCLVRGTAQILSSGEIVDAVRVKFPWARGALVVTVEQTSLQL